MSEPQNYVAGFMFTHEGDQVVLVRKNRPDWQAGRLNGVGGKIEHGERATAAMVREFEEETGVHTRAENWEHYATIGGQWGAVYVFRCFAPYGTVHSVQTAEDEEIEIHITRDLPYECLPNLSWLIPLGLYRHDNYCPVVAWERK